jgi:hypothetical protein
MQDGKSDNLGENIFIVPVSVPPQYDNFGMRSRDLTIITHHHHYGNNMMPNSAGIMPLLQAAQMQEALMATQTLLLEQRNFTKALVRETQRLLDSKENDVSSAVIEDMRDKKSLISNHQNVEDALYEILEDKRQLNEEKSNLKEKEMSSKGIDEEMKKNLIAIEKSIEKQLHFDNEPPFTLYGKVPGMLENGIICAPVIFTIRNDIWRDRVRYIIQNHYYNNNTGRLEFEKNQENNNMAVVVLYNSKKEPIELLVIYQISLETYLFKMHEQFSDIKRMIDVIVDRTIKIFNLIHLDKYFIIFEPRITNKTPLVINKTGEMLGDLIKIKPVLSFSRKEQRFSLKTYLDNINETTLHIDGE